MIKFCTFTPDVSFKAHSFLFLLSLSFSPLPGQLSPLLFFFFFLFSGFCRIMVGVSIFSGSLLPLLFRYIMTCRMDCIGTCPILIWQLLMPVILGTRFYVIVAPVKVGEKNLAFGIAIFG